jgi:hypothetical protein
LKNVKYDSTSKSIDDLWNGTYICMCGNDVCLALAYSNNVFGWLDLLLSKQAN